MTGFIVENLGLKEEETENPQLGEKNDRDTNSNDSRAIELLILSRLRIVGQLVE